jgi:amino acid transporter
MSTSRAATDVPADQHDVTATLPGMRRVLGSWGAAAVSVGVMAPTLAISIVGPEPARLVGRAAPLAFGLAAVLVFLVSAGFVRLSAEFASAGSVYAFVGRSVGARAGAFTGWVMLGTYLVFPWVSVAGITVFGLAFLDTVGLPRVDWYVVALVGWLLVGCLAATGIRPAARALLAFEIVAVLLILVLMGLILAAIGGGTAPRGQAFTASVFVLPDGVPLGSLVLAATLGFLAFAGFESAGSLGEEARLPRRSIPRAMLLTIGLGAVFYVACVAVQVLGFGVDSAGVAAFAGSAAPLSELALSYVGPGMAAGLNLVALVSAVGAGLGCVVVAVRLLFAFARDGLLPAPMSRVSRRTGAPTVALEVELTVGLVLITAFRLAGAAPVRMFFVLATVGVLNLLIMYTITNVAAVRHLRRAGTRPLALVFPAAGALVAVAVLARNVWPPPEPAIPLVVAGWLALGLLFLWVRRHRLAGVVPGSPAPSQSAGIQTA